MATTHRGHLALVPQQPPSALKTTPTIVTEAPIHSAEARPITGTIQPDPHYGLQVCDACHGAGYVRAILPKEEAQALRRIDPPVGHPLFGKIVPCDHCGVQAQTAMKALRAMTVLPDDLTAMDASWETFPTGKDGEVLVDMTAVNHMRDYTAKILAGMMKKRGAVLYGANQIGKTGMAYCVHQDLITAHIPSIFIGAIDLFERFQAAQFHTDPERGIWLMEKFSTVTHLVIDDLGSEKSTEKREETLFNLLNHRAKNPRVYTLITTNADRGVEFCEKIGTRAYSRITGNAFAWIKVKGKMNCLTGGMWS